MSSWVCCVCSHVILGVLCMFTGYPGCVVYVHRSSWVCCVYVLRLSWVCCVCSQVILGVLCMFTGHPGRVVYVHRSSWVCCVCSQVILGVLCPLFIFFSVTFEKVDSNGVMVKLTPWQKFTTFFQAPVAKFTGNVVTNRIISHSKLQMIVL